MAAYQYITQKLRKAYPSLVPGKDYDVTADSDNANIKIVWRHASPAPALQTIDAAYTDADIVSEQSAEALNDAFELLKKDKVLVRWIANIANIPLATARAQLKAIWDALP